MSIIDKLQKSHYLKKGKLQYIESLNITVCSGKCIENFKYSYIKTINTLNTAT